MEAEVVDIIYDARYVGEVHRMVHLYRYHAPHLHYVYVLQVTERKDKPYREDIVTHVTNSNSTGDAMMVRRALAAIDAPYEALK